MSENNIFEQASRLKLRFKTDRGLVSIEDLWDASLPQLDTLAKGLSKAVQEDSDVSFITPKKTNVQLSLSFEIVKHVINVKLVEQNERLVAKEKAARRAKITEILETKQDESLRSKTQEELLKELAELN